MKYSKLSKEILDSVGGIGNVDSVTHCVTRLRFFLKDLSKASNEKTKSIDGVMNVNIKNGQYQVIIGTHVKDVYENLIEEYHVNASDEYKHDSKKEEGGFFSRVLNMFQTTVAPLIGAMAGTAMVKALLQILVVTSLITRDSNIYIFFNMVSDGMFYFLPFFYANSASKYFKTNPYISMIFAGAMLHPTFTAMVSEAIPFDLVGLPIRLVSYSSTFIPILLTVWIQSYIEKFADKYSPSTIRIFFAPMLTVLIVAPIAFIGLGPLGWYLGDILAKAVFWLDTNFGWLVVAVIAGAWPLLVMTGMHSSLAPIQGFQRTTFGYATLITPAGICSNMASAGSSFAVSLKSKNKNVKAVASSASVSSICGITEPAVYGLGIPLKTPLIGTIIGGASAGLYSGLMNVKAWGSGSSNIFSLPIFIGEDNSFVHAIIMIIIAIVVAFIATFIMYNGNNEAEVFGDNRKSGKSNCKTKVQSTLDKAEVFAPFDGEIISLSEVNDLAFSEETMGKGVAMIPKEDIVRSPIAGVVEMLFDTKHAVGIVSDDGLEVLIHIGIDTVKSGGEHFEALVTKGNQVEIGTPLIKFNSEKLLDSGYDLTTPIIITNTNTYLDVIETSSSVTDDKPILTVIK